MKRSYPYLNDSTFLEEVDRIRNKEQFVRITILDFYERPLQAIEGRTTGGSVTIDGNSTVRRSCNLSLVAYDKDNDLTNVDNLLSINKKASLEIGYKNITNQYKDYDVLWFPMGIYVMNSPSISHSLDGVNISLQLKDKMCLLNGECGGLIPASTTFHEYDTIDENGKYVTLKPTIYQIIYELVNHFGGEQVSKIIINDLDTRVKQVMKWTGTSPLYVIEKREEGVVQYLPTTDGSEAAAAQTYKMYEYGDDVGYIYTDFTYPGELIGDAGSSVCDILDQILGVLGNYEYFYDIEGNFIFQEKKNYINTSQPTVVLDQLKQDDYLVDMEKGKAVYVFDDATLITSFSNAPQYNMIKNDFIVWGMKEDANGNSWPIRYHLAIDKKPDVGNTYDCFFYQDELDGLTKAKCPMKFDSARQFPKVGQAEVFYMDTSDGSIYEWVPADKEYKLVIVGLEQITTKDWRQELYLSGCASDPLATKSNYYYTELKNEWPKLYDIKNGKYFDETLKYQSDIDYFLDFIDSHAAIGDLSVQNIGRRQKIIVDESVNCIFEPEIPDLVIINIDGDSPADLRAECEAQGQDYVQVGANIYNLLAIGGHFNSAYVLVRELLYQYTSYNESISLNTLPILYLEPNTRITVRDGLSNIYGDYMINTITIPLDISSTMTLSCTRALDRL